jgi:hypothetical protein
VATRKRKIVYITPPLPVFKGKVPGEGRYGVAAVDDR